MEALGAMTGLGNVALIQTRELLITYSEQHKMTVQASFKNSCMVHTVDLVRYVYIDISTKQVPIVPNCK